ncbi:RICIN domain-containing protein [Frankia tisae]|uniref:RICIN domain-containing protein n=1 Tax=Frankia tisae TaxID=2950104 RepID=UPI0021BFFE16|nr:RICIN domain-containing protein [Frankia tisae]
MSARGTSQRGGRVIAYFVVPLAVLAVVVGLAAAWGSRSYFSEDASSAATIPDRIPRAGAPPQPPGRSTSTAFDFIKIPSTPPPSAASPSASPSPSASALSATSTAPSSPRVVATPLPGKLPAPTAGAAAPGAQAGPVGAATRREPAQVAPAPARTIPATFANLATGFCLDSNRESGYTLGCNGTDYQKWTAYGYGEIVLSNKATGLCLASDSDGRAFPVACATGDRQRWTMREDRYGTVNFVSVGTGRCLDSNADRQLYTMDCNGGSYQRWDRG